MKLFMPPFSESAEHLDAKVREKLASSLEHILSTSHVARYARTDAASLPRLVNERRQKPGVFGRYFDVVFSLRSGDPEKAIALLREMEAMATSETGIEVKPLDEAVLGADAERYARILGRADAAIFARPEAPDWQLFDRRVRRALERLFQIHAQLATEVSGLLVEIIGSVPAPNGRSFGSASSLTLWGAAVMNLRQHVAEIDVMDGLIHEAAHHLLFGLAIDEPLVRNPDKARFTSPLRKDPRPMNGVFHATFVCARLHLFYATMLGSDPSIATSDRPLIARRLEDQTVRVRDGLSTIARHADLTSTGEAVLEDMRSYMADAA